MSSRSRTVELLRCTWLVLSAVACGHGSASSNDIGPPAPVVEYVRKQESLSALPVRVRLPSSDVTEHVVVLYRTWGSQGWKVTELARNGQTWSGEVPCREVGTVTGDTKYFILALDGDGDLVGGSGTPEWPHVATIVSSMPGGPRSLHGGVAARCHDPSDCPPDFPGCPAYAFRRRACHSDQDCFSTGERCAWDGYCGSASADTRPLPPMTSDEELEAAITAVTRRYKNVAAR